MVNMNNEPAMPVVLNGIVLSSGMTKREAMALQITASLVARDGSVVTNLQTVMEGISIADLLLSELDRTSK